MEFLENKTYDELQVGDSATFSRTLTKEDVWLFACVSQDYNPVHLDEEYAKTTMFDGTVAHGMICASMLSAAVANLLPGPGSIYLGQEFKLRNPARPGDILTGEVKVLEKKRLKNIVLIECTIKNQDGKVCFSGISTVIAPSEKLRVPKPKLPVVTMKFE